MSPIFFWSVPHERKKKQNKEKKKSKKKKKKKKKKPTWLLIKSPETGSDPWPSRLGEA